MTAMTFDGDEICFTLTARNASGGQRMPDKQNFSCILVEVENDNRNSMCGELPRQAGASGYYARTISARRGGQ